MGHNRSAALCQGAGIGRTLVSQRAARDETSTPSISASGSGREVISRGLKALLRKGPAGHWEDQWMSRVMRGKTIITGATGMVGEGVLLECLNHPDVEQVLVINRKLGGVSQQKLREIIHIDFFNLAPIEQQLIGFNACFFCLGVSSVGIGKEEYKHITYDLTLNMAQLLAKVNPEITFCYVTGAGTDSSEQGRIPS